MNEGTYADCLQLSPDDSLKAPTWISLSLSLSTSRDYYPLSTRENNNIKEKKWQQSFYGNWKKRFSIHNHFFSPSSVRSVLYIICTNSEFLPFWNWMEEKNQKGQRLLHSIWTQMFIYTELDSLKIFFFDNHRTSRSENLNQNNDKVRWKDQIKGWNKIRLRCY